MNGLLAWILASNSGGGGGTSDHSELTNLSFANSGHTGFASEEDISTINAKIPNQASSANQLADKEFVNSTVATETAHYISNNGNPFNSLAELEAYSGTVTNNDYAIVTGTDEHGNTYFDRYKASVSGSTITWAKEYRLNNSSFTAVQWATINSGITALLVADYNSHIVDSTIHVTSQEKTDIANSLKTTSTSLTDANKALFRGNIEAIKLEAYDSSATPVDGVLYYVDEA